VVAIFDFWQFPPGCKHDFLFMDPLLHIGMAISGASLIGLMIFGYASVLYLASDALRGGFRMAVIRQKIPLRLRRFGVICTVCFAGSLALSTGTWLVREHVRPAGLAIHIDALPWESVTVESTNLPQPRRFRLRSGELFVSPIAYGQYRVAIGFPDGRSVWTYYFHLDTGLRRRVDLFVSPSTRAGYIHFRQTENGGDELFSGETRPEDTTAEKPFSLSGI